MLSSRKLLVCLKNKWGWGHDQFQETGRSSEKQKKIKLELGCTNLFGKRFFAHSFKIRAYSQNTNLVCERFSTLAASTLVSSAAASQIERPEIVE